MIADTDTDTFLFTSYHFIYNALYNGIRKNHLPLNTWYVISLMVCYLIRAFA